MSADDFRRLIENDLFSPLIPIQHIPIAIHGEDRILRNWDHKPG